MFYSQSLLSRKGPLGNIWVAGYCFKKLKKNQIADTDITSSVDKIIPEIQISYRVLAQLLLGVVRIFSKKVDYLYHDCNEALTNIRKSFTPRDTTAQRKWNSPQYTAQKKANSGPQHGVGVATEVEVNHAVEQNSSTPKNIILEMQMGPICAPYHEVTITLPEHLELDAFDLDVAGEGDTIKHHEKSAFEDEWRNEKNQHSFLDEQCHHMEVDSHAENSFSYLPPVDDVIPSNMMDLAITEFYNSSSVEVRETVEESLNREGLKTCKPTGAYLHDEQQAHQVRSVNLQDKMPSNIQRVVQFNEPENQVEPVNLHDTVPTHNEESHDLTEGNSEARTLDKAQDKSDAPSDSGLPSPKFAVTTPARKETRRICKKRRIPFDDTIVLSNGTMRTWIHDASNLVCKRRKAPHTSLDAWRGIKITYFQQNLMEPVIPYISSEHKAILHKMLSEYSPQKKSARSSSVGLVNLQHETPNKPTEPQDSHKGNTPAHTPPHDPHKGNTPTDTPPANYSEISTPDRSEVRMQESSPLEITASALDMMDKFVQELDSIEKESTEQDDGWSARTRAVAKYLFDRFLDIKEQKTKEILNLDRILEGQTRTKSARFFYETLTLKGHSCIDVEQGSPYSEIIISACPQLEALVKNR